MTRIERLEALRVRARSIMSRTDSEDVDRLADLVDDLISELIDAVPPSSEESKDV